MFLTVGAGLCESVLLEVVVQGRNGSAHPVPPIKAQEVLLLGWDPPGPSWTLGVLTRLTLSLAILEELPDLGIQIQVLTTNANLAKGRPEPNPHGGFL